LEEITPPICRLNLVLEGMAKQRHKAGAGLLIYSVARSRNIDRKPWAVTSSGNRCKAIRKTMLLSGLVPFRPGKT
jgi:hypothetical protein